MGGRGSSFFGARRSKNPPPSSKNPTPIFEEVPLSFIRPIFDLFFEAEDRRWGFLDLQLRRSKIEDGGRSSIIGSEDRRWGGSSIFVFEGEDGGAFDLRVRRSKMEGFFDLRLQRSKMGGFSIFGTEDRRLKKEGGSSKKGTGCSSKKGEFFEGGFF